LSLKRSAAALAARLPDGAAPEQRTPAARVPERELGAAEDRGRLLTCHQVGELLGVRPREVSRFITTRGLPGVHLGRKLGWRVFERDLWAWLDRLRQGGAA
jgi:hypothetical protein